CVILSGVDTVLHDNAALSVRAEELQLDNADVIARRQPLRVIVDSQLRLQPPARIFAQPGQLAIATINDEQKRWEPLVEANVQIVRLPAQDNRVDLHALM